MPRQAVKNAAMAHYFGTPSGIIPQDPYKRHIFLFSEGCAWQKEQHEEALFQMYMTIADVKALKKAVLGATDVAKELCVRCDNIVNELNNHLKTQGFKPPKTDK